MQLTQILRLEGTIELLSGLHIGAGKDGMSIGGTDSPVVRNPIDNTPYIPGSSLKGKMRSLLEWRTGLVAEANGAAFNMNTLGLAKSDQSKKACEHVLRLFGIAGDAKDEAAKRIGPTRLRFHDCPMSTTSKTDLDERGLLYTEIKNETAIDRITGTAKNGSLRATERVPAGVRFDFRVTLKCLDAHDDELLNVLLEGMRMLEDDSLGGSGSRGYGRVRFCDLTLNGEDAQARFSAVNPFPNSVA